MTRKVLHVALCAGAIAALIAIPADAEQASAQQTQTQAQPAAPAERVDLNTATAVELEALPGIGPRTAELIVEYRREQPFARVEDLMNIRGIGERTFLRLRPLIRVSDAGPAGP